MARLPMLNLGSDKHVFTDTTLIDTNLGKKTKPGTLPAGLEISVHAPTICPTPILGSKMPWETSFTSNGSVIEEEGYYRFYYECLPQGIRSNSIAVACIESEDGEHWVKPDFGIVEFNGSRQNNLVFDSNIAGRPVNTVSIFRDFIAETARRFKLSYVSPSSDGDCVFTAISDNGHQWNTSAIDAFKSEFLIHNIHTDLDTRQGKYVVFLNQDIHGLETITRSESYSFDCLPSPEPVFKPASWKECGHLNSSTAYAPWPDGDSYLMFITTGSNTIQMLTSRDGFAWDSKPKLPINNSGFLQPGAIFSPCTGLFRSKNGDFSLIVAVTENPITKPKIGANKLSDNYYIITWPEDGLMSLEAVNEGAIVTKPFIFTGETLNVNASINQKGYIKFELIDATANQTSYKEPIENREFKDCDDLKADKHNHLVTWSGESSLSKWSGRPVRLAIRMKKSRLHSLHFKKEIRSVTENY